MPTARTRCSRVFPETPAAAAGLVKGDVVAAVNGAPASNLSLAALRALLSGPAGTVVTSHVFAGHAATNATSR